LEARHLMETQGKMRKRVLLTARLFSLGDSKLPQGNQGLVDSKSPHFALIKRAILPSEEKGGAAGSPLTIAAPSWRKGFDKIIGLCP